MPLRPVNREQAWLLPPTLDEILPEDHPARFVAAFVDGLDRDAWAGMQIDTQGNPLGAPAYDPQVLLNIWLYGFMTGVRSCRKLEAACRDQIPFLGIGLPAGSILITTPCGGFTRPTGPPCGAC